MGSNTTKLVVILSALALLLPGAVILFETDGVSAAPAYGRISVSGSDLTVNGDASAQFFGVVDTTALQFAIMAYINGDMTVAGKTSVFNGPDTGGDMRMSQNANAEEFWHQYFALLAYYDCNIVRIGAGDTWGTELQYQAWLYHHDEYMNLLKIMLDEAYEHGVWVVLVLAGSQGESNAPYGFGGSGSAFVAGSSAFNRYVEYCRDVMGAFEYHDALGFYDMWNEPDHNIVNQNYWKNDKVKFNTWAKAVAAATAGASTHPRTMGVAGYGTLFGWSQSDFDLSTGKTGFEIAHRHFYAQADDAYLFTDPEQWAANDNLPLFWGELAKNNVYPLVRWTFGENTIYANGGQAITSMVLTGTTNYPYRGGTLPDPVNPPATPDPADPELPPLVITITPPVQEVSYGDEYVSTVTVSDTATVSVTYDAPFLSYDQQSHTLSGTPGQDEVGTYNISVTATASDGRTTTQEYHLIVSAGDEPTDSVNVTVVPTVSNAGYVLGGGSGSAFLTLVMVGLVLSALGCIHIFGGAYRRKR